MKALYNGFLQREPITEGLYVLFVVCSDFVFCSVVFSFPKPILMLIFIVFLVNEGASCCRVFGLLFRGVLKIS